MYNDTEDDESREKKVARWSKKKKIIIEKSRLKNRCGVIC